MLDWIGDHPLIAVLTIMTTLAFICQGIAALVEKKGRSRATRSQGRKRPRRAAVTDRVKPL